MNIPNPEDLVWEKVIKKDQSFHFEFLATKILVGRLALQYSRLNSPQTLQNCKRDLHNFFAKNSSTPKVLADLKKIID